MSRFYKVALVLLCALWTMGCAHVIVKPFTDPIPPMPEPEPKVALVGFFTYLAVCTNTTYDGNVITHYYVAKIPDKRGDLKGECTIGTPIEDIPATGTRDVSSALVDEFILRRRNNLHAKGFQREIDRIFVPRQEMISLVRDKGKDELRVRDVDYYVVASFGPPFFPPDYSYWKLGNILLTAFTLFTFPDFKSGETVSIFDIYDKDIHLVKTFKYEGQYKVISAWWLIPWWDQDAMNLMGFGSGAEMTPATAWKPDIKRFEYDFIVWLKESREKSLTGSLAEEQLDTVTPQNAEDKAETLYSDQHHQEGETHTE